MYKQTNSAVPIFVTNTIIHSVQWVANTLNLRRNKNETKPGIILCIIDLPESIQHVNYFATSAHLDVCFRASWVNVIFMINSHFWFPSYPANVSQTAWQNERDLRNFPVYILRVLEGNFEGRRPNCWGSNRKSGCGSPIRQCIDPCM